MRTTVFVCYSHEDGSLKNELIAQLRPCSDTLDVWSDNAIPPGVEWEPEIDRALGKADAAVIIVSPSLLNSKFVTERELPHILRRHKRDGMRPMWIHFRPVMYERLALSKFQALHDPKTALSKLRKPDREQALADIARKICEPPPERPMANMLRAADQVFISETNSRPGVIAKIEATGISMVTRNKHAVPFVKYDQLRARLSPTDLKVLRGHERSMSGLITTWERLHPKEVNGVASPDEARRLSEVRDALAREFDSAMAFIQSLGYNLDDHYVGVRYVLSHKVSQTPVGPVPKERATIGARFVLDARGRPQWSRRENGYWLQAWLNAAPQRTASVVWRMHSSISPGRETIDASPEFRKDFVSHGDFTLRADLRTTRQAVVGSVRRDLVEALEEQYPGRRSKPLQEALTEIAMH